MTLVRYLEVGSAVEPMHCLAGSSAEKPMYLATSMEMEPSPVAGFQPTRYPDMKFPLCICSHWRRVGVHMRNLS